MSVTIRKYESIDVDDLSTYMPPHSENFSLHLTIHAGSANSKGSDLFQALICTPMWLAQNVKVDEVRFGRGLIIVRTFEWNKIKDAILEYIREKCVSEDWESAARCLGRIVPWEFES